MSSTVASDSQRVGWVLNTGRGTLDLIFSCVATICFCTWTIQRLNIVPLHTPSHVLLKKKTFWMFVTLLAPEYVVWLALDQWQNAGKFRKVQVRNSEPWTRHHGFYIEMGGLFVKMVPSSSQASVVETVQTNPEPPPKLEYQVNLDDTMIARGAHGELDVRTDQKDITDISYTGGTTSTVEISIDMSQDTSGSRPERGVQYKIDMSDLLILMHDEVMQAPAITLHDIKERSKSDQLARFITFFQVIVFVTIVIGRLVVGLPTSLLELTTMAFICCAAAVEFLWWKKPLDIRSSTVLTIAAPREAGFFAVFPKLNFKPSEQDTAELCDPEHFFGRFVENSPLVNKNKASLVIIGCIFAAIHLLGWDFVFPTELEKWLWRIFGISSCGSLAFMYMVTWLSRDKTVRWVAVGFGAAFYSLSRLFLMVEVFVSLRSVPIRMYDTVSWEGALPHF